MLFNMVRTWHIVCKKTLNDFHYCYKSLPCNKSVFSKDKTFVCICACACVRCDSLFLFATLIINILSPTNPYHIGGVLHLIILLSERDLMCHEPMSNFISPPSHPKTVASARGSDLYFAENND